MRKLKALPALAALLLAPAEAAAQPTVYVCTQAAQVVAVNATTKVAEVIYTGSGSFSDCGLGPDGRLYIANDSQVIRFDPANPPPSGQVETVAAFSSAARGLSFNVTTLYVSTASPQVLAFPGTSEVTQGGSFPAPVGVAAFTPPPGPPPAGQGIAFAIDGPLWFVSGATVRQSLAPYATSQGLATTGLTSPIGVGVNTCGDLLVADQASQSVKRFSKNGGFLSTYLDFAQNSDLRKHFPRHFEIDASNRAYIVADSSTSGKDALILRAGPASAGVDPTTIDPTSSCASAAQVEVLAQLKASAISGLISNRAVGIAVGPTNQQITNTFSPDDCGPKVYNFGYHVLKLDFETCFNPFSLTVTALKSKPSEVSFVNNLLEFPTTPIEGMRYSPLGGYVIQYVYEEPLAPLPPQSGVDFDSFTAQYGFFTQEVVGMPGVAKAADHAPAAAFTTNVGHDYWDVGFLDASAGERENDFSKRVVFNSGLAKACTFGGFEEPLRSGNPQFNNPQNIKIAFKLSGSDCNGGQLRVSVARLTGSGFEIQDVVSGQQQDNQMDANGPGNYIYNLDTIGYVPGTYRITVWGNLISPTSKDIVIQN
jgi:hypothetical protein